MHKATDYLVTNSTYACRRNGYSARCYIAFGKERETCITTQHGENFYEDLNTLIEQSAVGRNTLIEHS